MRRKMTRLFDLAITLAAIVVLSRAQAREEALHG